MKKQGYAITGLMMVLLLAACNRQDQAGLEPMPENQGNQPAATSVAVPPKTAVAPATAFADHLSRSVMTDKYFTQVGTLVDGALVNDGSKDGYLLFGPYAPLRAGTYNLLIVGNIDSLPDGSKVNLDVASEKGKVVHGGQEVTQSGAFPSFDVVVAKDSTDLEVRIRVPQHAKVSVKAYQLVKKG